MLNLILTVPDNDMAISYSSLSAGQKGFTLVELIMTIVIIGIIGAVAAPRFINNNVFQSRGFADQVQATLRYAQKMAIAQRRNVCVTVTASNIALTIANASGAAVACGSPFNLPTGVNSITSPAAVTITPAPSTFNFDALGRPCDTPGNLSTVQKSIAITGTPNNIFVEPETGYVHSP